MGVHITEELALPPVKIHCSVLAEDAVKAAIFDFRFKKGLLPDDDVLGSVPATRPADVEADLTSEDIEAFTEEARAEKLLGYHRLHGRVGAADSERLQRARAAADAVRARHGITARAAAGGSDGSTPVLRCSHLVFPVRTRRLGTPSDPATARSA